VSSIVTADPVGLLTYSWT
jgi:hypothetical protein